MARRRVVIVLLSVAFVIAVAAGIIERLPHIGTLTEGHHQWLIGHQIKFVDYWSLDGLWTDRLLTLESPRSIETETIAARGVYVSYLPGGTLQLYLLHRLLPDLP